MTEVAVPETVSVADPEPASGSAGLDVVDEQLIASLVDRARDSGLRLTGEGGVLQQLTKRVLESALDGEITDHLGYDVHDAAGRGSGNYWSRPATAAACWIRSSPTCTSGSTPGTQTPPLSTRSLTLC